MYKDFSTHNDNVDSYNRMDESNQYYPNVRSYQKNLLDLKYSVDLMRDYNFRFHKDYGGLRHYRSRTGYSGRQSG